eukprot:7714764-Pyramimonas_sp.AAC.1
MLALGQGHLPHPLYGWESVDPVEAVAESFWVRGVPIHVRESLPWPPPVSLCARGAAVTSPDADTLPVEMGDQAVVVRDAGWMGGSHVEGVQVAFQWDH